MDPAPAALYSGMTEQNPAADHDASDEALGMTAYVVGADAGWTLEPASPRRGWMDDTGGFAYRCLPLSIANQCGWVIRSPAGFSAVWDGGVPTGATHLAFDPEDERFAAQILSHFGWGIVTFSLPWLFRTPPGYALMVRGATNHWIPGAAPLDGIVETDWATSTFTMNWRLTDPGRSVRFEKGDPICFLCPYPLEAIERFRPSALRLESNPELEREYREWSASRSAFNANPARKPSEWQKDYVKGETPTGKKAREHRSRLKVRPFEDLS
jgi:hypothetical protein